MPIHTRYRVKASYDHAASYGTLERVGYLESGVLSGWYAPSKAKYCEETDRLQVVWTKDEKDSMTEREKRLNLDLEKAIL